MTIEELFDLFVTQILNGGYVKDGKFCKFDPRYDTPASSLVSLAELKINFVRVLTENAQNYVKLYDSEEACDEDDFYDLESEILSCIPAIQSYHDGGVSVFREQLRDAMVSLLAGTQN